MLKGLNEELAFPILQKRRLPDPPEKLYPLVGASRVMVTGAGGSVGSELVLQIAAQQLAHSEQPGGRGSLILVDSSEVNLYEINQTLAKCAPDLTVHAYIADVRHEHAMASVFDRHKPAVVFHAAALKHVPLLENDHNLIEAVLTNVGGTLNVQELAMEHGADMVLVSTDKAVEPSSVMGLTKRAAERAYAMKEPEGNCLSIVRFGNVLGSSGSVVPLFRRQIAQGGPVTITHPEMTRYMMTIREAAELVVRAASVESNLGKVQPVTAPGLYVLDMGEPIKIMELAEQMIRHSGLRPGRDIEVKIIGIRPGEKLHEKLFYPWEEQATERMDGVHSVRLVGQARPPRGLVSGLLGAARARDSEQTKALLLKLVPEYTGADQWK